MNLSEPMREALVDGLKVEARGLGLSGDAFWSYVWSGVEAACIESGDLPRKRKQKVATA